MNYVTRPNVPIGTGGHELSMRKNTKMSTIFITERLRVRQYTPDDAAHFFRLSGDEEVMRYIRPVSTREESDKFLLENIDFYRVNPRRGRWAVEDNVTGEFIGSFAIIPTPSHPGKTQMGYSLLPENWGKGYASELTAAGLEFYFNGEPANEIYGITETPNVASQKVLLKNGFMPAGTFMEGEKELLLFIASRGR